MSGRLACRDALAGNVADHQPEAGGLSTGSTDNWAYALHAATAACAMLLPWSTYYHVSLISLVPTALPGSISSSRAALMPTSSHSFHSSHLPSIIVLATHLYRSIVVLIHATPRSRGPHTKHVANETVFILKDPLLSENTNKTKK